MKEGTYAVLLQSVLDEKWRADSMECCCYLRNIQDLLSDGKTPYERRFGMLVNGQVIPFGAMVEYHSVIEKEKSRLHQSGPRVLPGKFLGHELYAVEFGKEIFVADIEALEILDTSEMHARSFQEVITPKNGEIFIFPIADGTVELLGRDHGIRRSTLMRDQPLRSEELSGDPQGMSDKSQPIDEITNDGEARNDFWSNEGNYICRDHVELRVQFCRKKKQSQLQ